MNLLDLRPDLLGGVVFAWLDTQSIVRLDSSVCSTVSGEEFLEFLESEYAVLRYLPPPTPTINSGNIQCLSVGYLASCAFSNYNSRCE